MILALETPYAQSWSDTLSSPQKDDNPRFPRSQKVFGLTKSVKKISTFMIPNNLHWINHKIYIHI